MPPDGVANILGATFRDRDKLISGVSRHLLKRNIVDDYAIRGMSTIHPSEASHENWCRRAVYYRLTGATAEAIPTGLAMEMVYETGNDAHTKWQTWFREMGVLRGMWKCLYCQLYWYDTSPTYCPRCDVSADLIEYAEVPFSNKEYLLAGQADGDVLGADGEWRLIEAKTIGAGTVRIEAPKLYERYSYTHVDEVGVEHKGVDFYKLWNGIRTPFPSHLRQGMIYLFCSGRKEIVFIYDPKFLTAYPKEFEIKFRKSLIEPILEQCLLVKKSLDVGHPPKRPMWAEKTCQACKRCPYRSTCYDSRFDSGTLEEPTRRKSRTRQERVSPPTPPKVRFAETSFESD